jgi:nucleotide-binding universal stress UspA family protein
MIPRKEYPDSAQSFQHWSLRARLSPRTIASPIDDLATPPHLQVNWDRRIRNILVPTDFSPVSVEAVAQAAALARRYDALLTILHVIDINPPSARTHVGPAEELMRQLWTTGSAEMLRLSKSLAQQQTRTQTRIIEGLPTEVIIANSSSFDLLVINEEHARSPWKLFSRHTVRRVIEGAACPVMVVHERPSGLPQGTAGKDLTDRAETCHMDVSSQG